MALEHLTVEYLSLKDLTRIFSKVEIHPDLQYDDTPCWIWCATRNKWGYGSLTWKHWPYSAHRFIYAWLVHSLPKNSHEHELDHLCRRPSCVNPCHLEVVPSQVNHQRGYGPDALNSRKTHCINGHAFKEHGLFTTIRGNPARICRLCRNARTRDFTKTEKGKALRRRADKKRANNPARREAHRKRGRERWRRIKAARDAANSATC